MTLLENNSKNLKPSFLILGAKEYPLGAGAGEDAYASGGMEAYTQQLAPLLAARGARVLVVTRKFARQPARETRAGVEIYRVGWLKGFLLRNPSFNLNALRETLFAPRGSFDVIIANGVIATLAGIVTKWFRRFLGERVVVIARPAGIAWVQPQYNTFVKMLLFFLESIAYKLADAVVFLSKGEREQFEKKMGFLPKRVALIPTGVDFAKFERATSVKRARMRVRKQLGLRGKTIVFVGRLIQVKGLEYLIQAMQRVRDAQLAILGDGPLRASLEKQAEKLGVKNKMVFVKNASVPELLNACDVFVLPSLSEGLPNALLEAMAAKRACVVTDIGLPVRDGVDALVVPPKNSNALANALNKILADARLRKRLGENALARVKKEFNWASAVNAYFKLAENLKKTKL